MIADLAHDLEAGRVAVAGIEGDAGAGDAGLVQHALPKLGTEHVSVVAADIGEGTGDDVEGSGLVVAATDAGFEGGPDDFMLFEEGKGEQDRDLVEGVGVGLVAQAELCAERADAVLPGSMTSAWETNWPPMLKRSR